MSSDKVDDILNSVRRAIRGDADLVRLFEANVSTFRAVIVEALGTRVASRWRERLYGGARAVFDEMVAEADAGRLNARRYGLDYTIRLGADGDWWYFVITQQKYQGKSLFSASVFTSAAEAAYTVIDLLDRRGITWTALSRQLFTTKQPPGKLVEPPVLKQQASEIGSILAKAAEYERNIERIVDHKRAGRWHVDLAAILAPLDGWVKDIRAASSWIEEMREPWMMIASDRRRAAIDEVLALRQRLTDRDDELQEMARRQEQEQSDKRRTENEARKAYAATAPDGAAAHRWEMATLERLTQLESDLRALKPGSAAALRDYLDGTPSSFAYADAAGGRAVRSVGERWLAARRMLDAGEYRLKPLDPKVYGEQNAITLLAMREHLGFDAPGTVKVPRGTTLAELSRRDEIREHVAGHYWVSSKGYRSMLRKTYAELGDWVVGAASDRKKSKDVPVFIFTHKPTGLAGGHTYNERNVASALRKLAGCTTDHPIVWGESPPDPVFQACVQAVFKSRGFGEGAPPYARADT